MNQLDLFANPVEQPGIPEPRRPEFLESPVVTWSASRDDGRRWWTFTDVRVVVEAFWRDAGRAFRAVELVDRELRRCAAAYESSVQSAMGDGRQVPASADFIEALAKSSTPTSPPRSALEILRLDGPPLRVELRPTGSVLDCLLTRPVTTVAFTAAAFGTPFELGMHRLDPDALAIPGLESWTVHSDRHRVASPYRRISAPRQDFAAAWAASIVVDLRDDDGVGHRVTANCQ